MVRRLHHSNIIFNNITQLEVINTLLRNISNNSFNLSTSNSGIPCLNNSLLHNQHHQGSQQSPIYLSLILFIKTDSKDILVSLWMESINFIIFENVSHAYGRLQNDGSYEKKNSVILF
mmetsp:Transcript_24030/g.66592  ORF Transcript_24030/g.66592 Transcript_24030/m.66592 type:complete len:118 (-) Transcript_24030:130-483(-)